MSARVVIAGGGIAGVEAALALADLAEGLASIAVVAPDPDFVLKPLTVEEPFTEQPAERHELGLALTEIGAEHVSAAVREVDPQGHEIALADGARLGYDQLVVCIGGRNRAPFAGVESFAATSGDLAVNDLVKKAADSPSATLALLVPPATSWSLPLYELALLLRRRSEELDRHELRLRLVTPESAPLVIFGEPAAEAVASLMSARRVDVETSRYVSQRDDGTLMVAPENEPLGVDVCLSLPVIEGPAVHGLPADEHGFIPIDLHARVRGVEDVYAAGDGTDFPVKQGGIATQQADAAAEHIAAKLGAAVEARPFEPVLRGQLITGVESLNLRHGLTGGTGEGQASLDYLWWPPQKVAGRYLSAWLGHTLPRDLEPPSHPLEVESSWPHEWHAELGSFDAERRR